MIKSHQFPPIRVSASDPITYSTSVNPEIYPPASYNPLLYHSALGQLSRKNLIVMHITQGSTWQGAYQTFLNSKSPNRVSCHFIIDQDGKIIQLLPISDIAWHASAVNGRSVGIEHVAVDGKLPVTGSQYEASASLVRWIGGMIGIDITPKTVLSHNVASPVDGHVRCCEPWLDIEKVLGLANKFKLPT